MRCWSDLSTQLDHLRELRNGMHAMLVEIGLRMPAQNRQNSGTKTALQRRTAAVEHDTMARATYNAACGTTILAS